MLIQSFACPDTESLFTTGKCCRFVKIKSVAELLLAQPDAAPSVNFMMAPPENDLKGSTTVLGIFESTAKGWLNLQAVYELQRAEVESGKAIAKEIQPFVLAA